MTEHQITSAICLATGVDVSDGALRVDLNKLHLAAIAARRLDPWFPTAWADALDTIVRKKYPIQCGEVYLMADPWERAEAMAKAIQKEQSA